MTLTNWLLTGMCWGQILTLLTLLCIYGKNHAIHERLGKIQLAVQELCDRIWDMTGEDE